MTKNFDPKNLNALAVRLRGRQIGISKRLGKQQIFAFEQDYVGELQRILSSGNAWRRPPRRTRHIPTAGR